MSQKKFKRYFTYDKRLGTLRWRFTVTNRRKGSLAGALTKDGYIAVIVERKTYKAHRIIWIMIHGKITKGKQLDHINGIRTDNRLVNLRVVTPSQNACNAKTHRRGIPIGVCFVKRTKSWMAQRPLMYGPKKYLGIFKTAKEAGIAVQNSRKCL